MSIEAFYGFEILPKLGTYPLATVLESYLFVKKTVLNGFHERK